jgi:hypothetical protein
VLHIAASHTTIVGSYPYACIAQALLAEANYRSHKPISNLTLFLPCKTGLSYFIGRALPWPLNHC